MSFFDLFGLDPQKVVDFLAKLHITVSVEFVDKTITILILLSIVFSIYIGIIKKGKVILSVLSGTRKWRLKYINQGLEHCFGDYLSPEKQKCYVPTQCQGTPPHNFDEPDEAVASSPKQELVNFFIEDVFTPSNANRRLYCILAGSGMGKTTFTVHLFVEYINKYKKGNLPYDIYIRDMGSVNVINDVKKLSDDLGDSANHSILLLDALDENLLASENFNDFRKALEDVISPFKFVVITCRSQFFPNELEIPSESSIRANTSEKNLLSYNKIYIRPFSLNDINTYIKKKYKGWSKKNIKRRRKAKAIIEKCKHLMARPVLLSYIDDLLDEEKDYSTETDIYETLIDKWLNREVNNIQDSIERKKRYEELVSFSLQLATKMYQNWRETGVFRVDSSQMEDFCRKNGFDRINYQFTRRSLINHDAAGDFKFSHKSFLEFFLAKCYFENPGFDFSFEGMDMAERFFQGFCKREYSERFDKNAFIIKSLENNRYLPYEEYTLVVVKRTDFDFIHLLSVIAPNHFSELELNWRAYDVNVQKFIEESGIHTITIVNYQKGDVGLRQILNSSDLEFVSIEGDDLPKSFIKEAEKKGVHVILNDQTIVTGTNPSFNSTLKLQLQLQMEKQLKMIQRERLLLGRSLINDYLDKEINEKERKS